MNDNIDKGEIRRAIDRLQAEHPCHFAFDATKFDSTDSIDVVKRVIDNVMESIRDDADIHIICEMAKLYLEGVRPMVMSKQEWIPCSERLPEDIRPVLVTWKNNDPASYYQYIVGKHFIGTAHYHRGKWYWYSSTTEDLLAEYGKCDSEEFDEAIEAVAWMPLPTPYKAGDPDA